MATNTTHATSQASVSESNRSRIVKHLYHNGISSRAQIAKALELTPAANHQNHRTPYRGRHD